MWQRLLAPLGLEHLQKELMGMGCPTSRSAPVAPSERKSDLEAVRRDMAPLHPPGRWLSGEFSLCWAVLMGWMRRGVGEDHACLTLALCPIRCLADDGVSATAGTESLALTVAVAVKRLHLCLLCVATAFPAAAGGPLLAGI